jgi:fructose-specific phosphotransferase system IIA component
MEIMNEQLINLHLEAQNKQDVIKQLGKLLDAANRLNDYDSYITNVLEREQITTTGIGFGIAIPHGKTDAVKKISVVCAHLNNPIDWNSLDGQKVDLVFQLAVPESSKGDEHLKLLSALSRKLIHEEFREQIRSSKTGKEVLNLISQSLSQALEA